MNREMNVTRMNDAPSMDWGSRSGEDTIGALAERTAGVGLSLARLSRKLGAALALVLAVFAMQSEAAKKETHANPRFSPDGKSLVFDRCDPDECRIHVYNLQTGTLGYYRPPPGDSWGQGYYSNAGDKLVFVTQPIGVYAQRHEILPRSQIAIMNLDGSNMRVVTHTVGYKGMPAFSHSGKKVIFAQAGRIRDEGATIASRWDLWEVDLEGGAANLFAGRFEFYQMGLSVYFPDDERVLLNAYGPSNQALVASGLAKDHADFDRLFKRNGVFALKRGQAVLAPPLFPDLGLTRRAILDAQGNMFFEADGGPGEGIRIRRVGLDGSRQSWRHPPIPEGMSSSIRGAHVSRDGRYFVVSESVGSPWGGMRRHGSKLMLLDTATGVWREVVLPREAKQINR